MKKGILLLLLVSSVFAQAQTLKEALFRGKLKSQPGTVIRKGDDLTKLDTIQSVAISDSAKTGITLLTGDTATNKTTFSTDSAVLSTASQPDTASATTDTIKAGATVTVEAASAPKDNNAAWKEYMNTFTNTLKTEVLPLKKIKSGTYYILVNYAIETDGQVTVSDVSVTPENDALQQQVKERINLDAPRLTPVLTSTGTPRKVTRKYNFTITKE